MRGSSWREDGTVEDALVPPQAWYPVLWACTRLVVKQGLPSFPKRSQQRALSEMHLLLSQGGCKAFAWSP